MKDPLRALLATIDPLRLLDEIRTVQHHLAGLAEGERVHVLPHRDADLERFLKSLPHAWREGEVRPTHRTGPKPRRYWRTRHDPFETTWPRVVGYLTKEEVEAILAQPDRTTPKADAPISCWRFCSPVPASKKCRKLGQGEAKDQHDRVPNPRFATGSRHGHVLTRPCGHGPEVDVASADHERPLRRPIPHIEGVRHDPCARR